MRTWELNCFPEVQLDLQQRILLCHKTAQFWLQVDHLQQKYTISWYYNKNLTFKFINLLLNEYKTKAIACIFAAEIT